MCNITVCMLMYLYSEAYVLVIYNTVIFHLLSEIDVTLKIDLRGLASLAIGARVIKSILPVS